MTQSLPEEMAIPGFSLDAFSLAGRTAIVSGGSDGIGRMIAHGFADAGANVVVAARGPEKIESVVAEIEAKGHAALGVPTDVTDPDAVRALVERTLERFGQVDILMNVVGGSQGPTFKRGLLLDLTKEDFNEAFNINVTSAFLCSQAVVPHMLERGSGVIINMASIGARDYRLPEPGMSVYNMTKAAVMHLTRSMAKEWAPPVRVNCINAGHFITPRRARTEHPDRRARSLAEIQIGRFGTPEDIAGAAVFMASDAGAFFNGSYLDLHGGT
ncbi:MAG: SDR family oxidoreductase [Chloroflexi bacterium]|nr:SDR family oxidoreductase [Chloroflexota bacterium]